MEEEFNTYIKVWVSAMISVSYCYYLPPRIKAGRLRLLSVLPVCALFLYVPLLFSTVHFSFTLSFFLSGLGISKLVLFSFDKGPLFPLPTNLLLFISLTCFPLKLQQNPKPQNQYLKWFYPIKVVLFVITLQVYDYKQYLPQIFVFGLYSLHIYLELDISLALTKFLATIVLGYGLEPQFIEPYLATSLHDFWGRRWNLRVSEILRLGVYVPVRQRRINSSESESESELDLFLGFLATFFVSGLAHELIFFYVSRETPTWEVTWFFVLHGVFTATEVAMKKSTQWRLNAMVSRMMTVGFVFLTSCWLFLPQVIRSNVMERTASESMLFIDFFKRKLLMSS